jgi:hypothetical protein
MSLLVTILLVLAGSPITPAQATPPKAAACCCDCPPNPLCPAEPSCCK